MDSRLVVKANNKRVKVSSSRKFRVIQCKDGVCLNAGMVTVELAVPLPVPVLEDLKQQAIEEGYDFEFDLVISLLHDWKDVYSLDIPSTSSNDRYRELFTLLDDFVFTLMLERMQEKNKQ